MALNEPLIVGPDRNGRSVAIVDGLIAAAAPAGAHLLSCPDGDITAGSVCAHTHIYSALAPYGMPAASPPPENFVQILERVWWRLDRALDAEALRAGAADYVARALLAGTTALIDHHESPNLIEGSLAVLAAECERFGMRALLCYGATERNFGVEEARRGLEENRRVPTSPLIRGMVGLHASFTVGDDTVRAAGALARELGTVVHVHVAEDGADVLDARQRGFAGPFERLAALDALPEGSIIVHGVHLDRTQVEAVSEHRCWLVQNPRSNEGNRVGYAGNLQYGSRVALGTDGWNADMAEEEAALMRLAAAHGDTRPGVRLPAGRALIAERFGTKPEPLTPGAVGDLVVRQNGTVRDVVVGGRHVVANGKLVGGDLTSITATAEQAAARLWERMRALS
jgi:cytosine/adenosine deaminase-related metal-dependent hydrolase